MGSVRRLLTLSTLAAVGRAACSSDTTNSFAPLGLALTLTPPVDTIFVADTLTGANSAQLKVSATSLGNAISTPGGVEWSTSDPNVATVNSSGLVVARGIGSATITARVNSSTAHTDLVVAYRVSQLTLSATSFANLVGDTVQFTASALDPNGTLVPGTAYAFTSADPTVAVVISPSPRTGRVVFLKTGVANVSVKAGGQTLDAGSVGLCLAATGAPQGPVSVVAPQPRVKGM